jgi:hypothetical protein
MSFLMEGIKKVERRLQAGFPSGVDEQSFRDVPLLLQRIQELESALLPFARVGKRGTQTPTVEVQFSDCKIAETVLTLEQHPTQYEYPL